MWPALRKLTIGTMLVEDAQAALWASVGLYLPQLVSLDIEIQLGWLPGVAGGERRRIWTNIFSPQHTTHTLTELTIPCDLRPWLVELLVQHAPALVSLGCSGVQAITDDSVLQGVPAHCSWTTLRLPPWPYGQWCHELTWLPMPAHGPLVIAGRDSWWLGIQLPKTSAVSGAPCKHTKQPCPHAGCVTVS